MSDLDKDVSDQSGSESWDTDEAYAFYVQHMNHQGALPLSRKDWRKLMKGLDPGSK